MSAEHWIVLVGVAVASWVFRSVLAGRELRERDEIERKLGWDLNEAKQAKEIARRNNVEQVAGCSLRIDRLTTERDAARAELASALAAKSAHFEESQKAMELLRRECRDATDLGVHATREADRLNAENVRLRKVAAAAAKLFNGKDDPGEFRELKDAVREWQDGGAA